MSNFPAFEWMRVADYSRVKLMARTKAQLIDLVQELRLSKEQELDKVHRELAEVRRVLVERKEAAHFEPIGLDGRGERALRALSVVLLHGRDSVVKDLTQQLVDEKQDVKLLEDGYGPVGKILLLVNPIMGTFPHMVTRMLAKTMTVRTFIQELKKRSHATDSFLQWGPP